MSGPNSIFFLTDNFFQSTQVLDPNQSLPEGSLDGNYILDVSPLGTVSFMSVVDNDGDNWFTYNSPLQTLLVNTAMFQAESIAGMLETHSDAALTVGSFKDMDDDDAGAKLDEMLEGKIIYASDLSTPDITSLFGEDGIALITPGQIYGVTGSPGYPTGIIAVEDSGPGEPTDGIWNVKPGAQPISILESMDKSIAASIFEAVEVDANQHFNTASVPMDNSDDGMGGDGYDGDHQDSDHQDDNTQNDNTQQNQGPLVFNLSGADIVTLTGFMNAQSGKYVVTNGDFNGQPAPGLQLVDDVDGDGWYAPVPNVPIELFSANHADLAAAEQEVLNLGTATTDDDANLWDPNDGDDSIIGSDHQHDDTNDGGDNTMPEWVSNTAYSVSDNSNVDGNADTVMFPVVAADYDAAKFFIWNGQDVQSIYKSDGSYFEGADFTAGVDASQIYVSNYVEAELDVYSITSGGIAEIVGTSGLAALWDQGYNNGATFAVQIGNELQLLGYGTDYFAQYSRQPVTGIDLDGSPETKKYVAQVKDGYVLYSSTFGSNNGNDGSNNGDGSVEILPSGSIQTYDRYEEINGQEVDDLSEAIGAIQAGPDGDPDAAADNGVYIDFSEANPASAASATNINMFDLSEGDETADVAVGGSSVDFFAIESSGVGGDGTVYVDVLDGGSGFDIAYAANAYTRLDQQNGEFDGIIIDLAEGTISFDDGGKLEVTNIESFTATSLDDIIVGGTEYDSYNSIQSFSPLGGKDVVWGADGVVTAVGYDENDSLGAQGVVIWTKTDENGDGVDVTYSTDAETGNLIDGFPNGYNEQEWVWRPYAAEFVNLDGTITNDGDAVVLDGSGFVDTMHNVDYYTGSSWNDVFIGGSGSDLFDGAGGSDLFNAAAGYDVLFVGGADVVDSVFTESTDIPTKDSVEIIRVSEGNFEVHYEWGDGTESWQDHTVSINGVEEVVISGNLEDYVPDLLATGAGGNRSTLQGDFEDSYVYLAAADGSAGGGDLGDMLYVTTDHEIDGTSGFAGGANSLTGLVYYSGHHTDFDRNSSNSTWVASAAAAASASGDYEWNDEVAEFFIWHESTADAFEVAVTYDSTKTAWRVNNEHFDTFQNVTVSEELAEQIEASTGETVASGEYRVFYSAAFEDIENLISNNDDNTVDAWDFALANANPRSTFYIEVGGGSTGENGSAGDTTDPASLTPVKVEWVNNEFVVRADETPLVNLPVTGVPDAAAEVADFVRARDIAEVIEAGAGSDMMSGRGGADTYKIGAGQASSEGNLFNDKDGNAITGDIINEIGGDIHGDGDSVQFAGASDIGQLSFERTSIRNEEADSTLKITVDNSGLDGDVANDVVFLFDQFNEQMTFRQVEHLVLDDGWDAGEMWNLLVGDTDDGTETITATGSLDIMVGGSDEASSFVLGEGVAHGDDVAGMSGSVDQIHQFISGEDEIDLSALGITADNAVTMTSNGNGGTLIHDATNVYAEVINASVTADDIVYEAVSAP